MSSKWAFISGPYRADTVSETARNIHRAYDEALKWWRGGYFVFCPHANSGFMDGACPDEQFLAADLEMVRFCDTLVALPGWRESAGATEEVRLAVRLGKTVWQLQATDAGSVYTLGGLDDLRTDIRAMQVDPAQ